MPIKRSRRSTKRHAKKRVRRSVKRSAPRLRGGSIKQRALDNLTLYGMTADALLIKLINMPTGTEMVVGEYTYKSEGLSMCFSLHAKDSTHDYEEIYEVCDH